MTVYLIVMLALPAQYVVGPLGSAGVPAQLLGLLAGVWWLALWLAQPRPASVVRQPLRAVALAFLLTVLVSYVFATVRPISGVELSQADRGLLSLLSWLSIMLFAMDGLVSRAAIDTLLRRLVQFGGVFAAFGVFQFVTGSSYVDALRLPGLAQNNALTDVVLRNGFFRPTGTALHAIEFGVVLTMLLPVALHYAVVDAHRTRFARWFPVAMIAVGLPMSISRSAMVGTFVGLAVLLPTWSAARRRVVYAAGSVLLMMFFVAVPGFLGSLLGLFTGIGGDASAKSRTDSYAIAFTYISRSPLFGRGFTTFLPSHHVLDNQFLNSMIDIGLVGLLALLALLVTPVVTAWRLRDVQTEGLGGRAAQPPSRLGPALAAGVAATGVCFAFYDALSFPTGTGLLFLYIGIIGALRRCLAERVLESADGEAAEPLGHAS